LLNITRNR